MPILGYGVWQVAPSECQRAVEDALEVGYRLIDTAAIYQNEAEVGAAIKASGLKRDEIFVTTKLWISDMSEERALRAFDTSMKKLELDVLEAFR